MSTDLMEVINRLKNNIEVVPKKYLSFTEDELAMKPEPSKWSKKEILGHLIDSATNNSIIFIIFIRA